MKAIRLKLVKHMVALIVFFSVCALVGQISVLAVELLLSPLGISLEENVEYSRWSSAFRTLLALTLAFYFSRKSLGKFDRFLDKRRVKLTSLREG